MSKGNYCSDCEIEFKVRHDSDDYMLIMYCPFCGTEIESEEQPNFFDDEEEG